MTISSRFAPSQALETNTSLLAAARLVLASIVLVAYLIDVPGKVYSVQLTRTAIAAYVIFSVVQYLVPQALDRLVRRPRQHWVDLGWYALLTAVTDPGTSGIFMFFLFAILSASFRHGTVAGIEITLGSVCAYLCIVSMLSFWYPVMEWAALILRSFFLTSLGLMISSWGGKERSLKRRLALLREINALSNPRFGMEQALVATLTKFRSFFDADSCLVLLHEPDPDRYVLREASRSGVPPELQTIPASMARLLQPFGREQAASFGPGEWRLGGRRNETRVYDVEQGSWRRAQESAGAAVAEVLNTKAFVSIPLQAGSDSGHLFLCSQRRRFRNDEVIFLAQAVEQAFRLIEHLRVLDHMASAAAAVERKRIVTDLHDTAIQPYIGLRMGLEALRAQADRDNPLAGAIDRLVAMTGAVIGDLRSYVRNLEQHHVAPSNVLFASLRERARRYAEDIGLRVELDLPEQLQLSDRLAAEIVQLVNEGLSNVNKHTNAGECRIRLSRQHHVLCLDISNPSPADGVASKSFVPRSISARAAALGGTADVRNDADGTSVQVCIPL